MISKAPNPRDIERWRPLGLHDILGNTQVVSTFQSYLDFDGFGGNMLLSGPSGTGKTAAVMAYVNTLNCPHRQDEPSGPCGTCNDCRQWDARFPDHGIFALLRTRVVEHKMRPLHYIPVNCATVTESQLKEVLDDSRDAGGEAMIFLDEVHRLTRRSMDHLLLKPLEDLDAVWIACTARTDDLDPMFKRRFATRVSTSLPLVGELAVFLANRCAEWQIRCDNPETVLLLAKKSRQIVSECIAVLARAAGQGRVLTRELVEEYPFLDTRPA